MKIILEKVPEVRPQMALKLWRSLGTALKAWGMQGRHSPGAVAGFMSHISALRNRHKTGETYFWICLVKVVLEG